MEYDSALIKKELLPFVTMGMNLGDVMLSQSRMDSYCVILFYMRYSK